MPPAWMADAACRGVAPARFYPPEGDPGEDALAICAGCPVRVECDEHATAAHEVHGIWGGRPEIERRRPSPSPRDARRPGPPPLVADDDLAELVDHLDPTRPAAQQLQARLGVSVPAAYKVLNRARRLGLIEQRGRNLYAVRFR